MSKRARTQSGAFGDDLSKFKIKNLSTDELKQLLLGNLKAAGADATIVVDALALAEELHGDDMRSNGPYVDHLLRCAARLSKYLHVSDPDLLVASLLHDAVEDHEQELAALNTNADASLSMRERALNYLSLRFNERVARIVLGVTNPAFIAETKRERDLEYAEHVRAAITDYDVFLMKFSDFNDNAIGLHHTHGARKMVKLAAKYHPLYDVFLQQAASFHDAGVLGDADYTILVSRLTTGKRKSDEYLRLA